MFSLTRQEQWIIAAIVAALLVGAAVKNWRLKQQQVEHVTAGVSGKND
jgi:hypothetical protein